MTTMTISEFIPQVKELLDIAVRDSYTDATVAQHVVEAFDRMHAVAPHTRYVGGVISDLVFPTATQALLALSVETRRRHDLGIVYFAAARCMETGITDSVNLQLSQTLKQQADAVFVS